MEDVKDIPEETGGWAVIAFFVCTGLLLLAHFMGWSNG